ncbi:MAG: hypothetical protein ACREQW_17600, partial [Candidatus Binatia bacterium]
DLQKINVKFFAADSHGIRLEDFIPIFNSWVQASDGAYYDIADYSHVQAGPGILVVAHEANVSIDCAGNRLGLLYNRKQPLAGTNYEKLVMIFRAALENCRRLEEEPRLDGKLKFLGHEALVIINDRLLAPNNEETFQRVRPEIESLARSLYGNFQYTLDRDPSAGKRFNVFLRTPAPLDTRALLKNLGDA